MVKNVLTFKMYIIINHTKYKRIASFSGDNLLKDLKTGNKASVALTSTISGDDHHFQVPMFANKFHMLHKNVFHSLH